MIVGELGAGIGGDLASRASADRRIRRLSLDSTQSRRPELHCEAHVSDPLLAAFGWTGHPRKSSNPPCAAPSGSWTVTGSGGHSGDMDRRVMIMCDTRASGITADLADSYLVSVEPRANGGTHVLWTDEPDQAMVFDDVGSAAEFCRDSPLEMFVVSFVPASGTPAPAPPPPTGVGVGRAGELGRRAARHGADVGAGCRRPEGSWAHERATIPCARRGAHRPGSVRCGRRPLSSALSRKRGTSPTTVPSRPGSTWSWSATFTVTASSAPTRLAKSGSTWPRPGSLLCPILKPRPS